MKEINRTLVFVAVAVVSVGAAAMTHMATKPKLAEGYQKVGEEFYPDFKDPTVAQVLRVVAYDEPTASVKVFKVEYRDGKWRIPSHYDYPVDGKDRLARTAASMIGTSRMALVSRIKSEHAKYGVVDPEDTNSSVLSGRGQKITVAKNDGSVLAEYVIGKKSDAPGQTDVYYLRATKTSDSDTVYRAQLKIDLSTKFSDWIEPSLLKVDRDALTDIRIDRYTIDQQQMQIVPGEITELTKKSANDPWKLVGMNEAKEELKSDVVNNLVNSLDSLKLVGVRPKPDGVKADLSLDPRVSQSPQLVFALRSDMVNRGFIVAKDPRTGQPHIFSNEGEMEAGTNEGVRYSLRFGQIFTGTDFEIETGLSKDKDPAKKVAENTSATPDKEKKDKEALKKSRYLMVYATYDPKLIGAPPSSPVEPKKPQGLVEAPTKPEKSRTPQTATKGAGNNSIPSHPAAGDKTPAAPGKTSNKQSSARRRDDSNLLAMAFDDAKALTKGSPTGKVAAKLEAAPASATNKNDTKATGAKEAPGGGKSSSNPPATSQPPKPTPKPPAKPDPKAEYDKAMQEYKKAVEKYKNDKSEYEKKLAKGQQKVKELNERFGPWYYVISAESFENLRLDHAALTKPKEKTTTPAPSSEAPGSALPQGK